MMNLIEKILWGKVKPVEDGGELNPPKMKTVCEPQEHNENEWGLYIKKEVDKIKSVQ